MRSDQSKNENPEKRDRSLAKPDFLLEPIRMLRSLCWLCLLPFFLTTCRKESRPAPGIEAYVWQDPDRPAVSSAMQRAAGAIATFHVRAAELRWNGRSFVVERPVSNRLPTPGCGLVLRIGASAAGLEWTDDQVAQVATVVRSLAALSPREIQCDYDCPQKRLNRYRALLGSLQKAAGKVPLVPTVLPSWMDEPDFPQLIRDRPGYVLQVHSLNLPKSPTAPVLLFDPLASRAAVKRAAALGVPFRVAMATYGCEVWFDRDDKVIEVVSEDLPPQDRVPARKSFAFADPIESAKLIEEWMKDPPAGLRAVIWYRLPIEGDRRNWTWDTLAKVSKGEQAAAELSFEAVDHAGTGDLFVMNRGGFPAPLPAEIIVTSPVIAADGAGAYRLEHRADGLHFIRRPEIWPWIDPGKKIPTGWLRTSGKEARMEWHFAP